MCGPPDPILCVKSTETCVCMYVCACVKMKTGVCVMYVYYMVQQLCVCMCVYSSMRVCVALSYSYKAVVIFVVVIACTPYIVVRDHPLGLASPLAGHNKPTTEVPGCPWISRGQGSHGEGGGGGWAGGAKSRTMECLDTTYCRAPPLIRQCAVLLLCMHLGRCKALPLDTPPPPNPTPLNIFPRDIPVKYPLLRLVGFCCCCCVQGAF